VIPAAGAHGGDGAAIAQALGLDPESVLDLSMSMNPYAPDAAALAARHLGALARYPNVDDGTELLATAIGVDPARLALTNGGSEAIALVAAVLGGGVQQEPEFGLHPRSDDGPRWRSNPNNPLGTLAGDDDRAEVWDEAFFPLSTGRWTRGDHEAVVVGSLTKVFACPGLRLGYVIADDVERFTALQPAWSVNALALAVLADLLDRCELPSWHKQIADGRAALVTLLAGFGLTALPSDAPWVLVRAAGLREALAPHGVVVRDCTSFGLPGHARIAVPDDDGLSRLEGALSCAAP
jgi:histidinol-phosphate/aromatic aminotransferase/cobyric acid decarboxylase-like protein